MAYHCFDRHGGGGCRNLNRLCCRWLLIELGISLISNALPQYLKCGESTGTLTPRYLEEAWQNGLRISEMQLLMADVLMHLPE